VDFLDGDPDQPIVTGRTYHANNIPPGTLPGSKTQMAFRSKTHKGEGYNELCFEDAKGSEALSLHAQRDMHTRVKHHQTLTVETADREITVQAGDEKTTIEQGNLMETICQLRSTDANQVQVRTSAGKAGDGTQLYEASDTIMLKVGAGKIVMTPESIKIIFGGETNSIEINASGVIVLGGNINMNK
nr:type VI secretion system tip protein VgrG [Photorhabdus tasmaniensis]